RVRILHNVTLGTNMGPDVPTIGNDVFIGCGASILGKVTIGDGARIAANSLVIADVPPGATAIGVPAKVMPNLSPVRNGEAKNEKAEGGKQALQENDPATAEKAGSDGS